MEEKKGTNNNVMISQAEKQVKIYGKEQGQLIIFVVLMCVVALLPFGRIVSDRVGLNMSMIVQQIFMVVVFGLSIIIVLIESINHRIQWKKYTIAYSCLFIMWLFSAVMSLDAAVPKFAFFGTALRGEGLLQIGGYYGIFVLASLLKKEKYKSSLIYVFLGMASVFSVLGVFQFLDIYMFKTNFPGMASFGFGNPNHVAAYMVLFSGCAMAGYWLYKENSIFLHPFSWWKRWLWLILVIISFIGCITTRSSSVYVGLCMIFLMLLFMSIVAKKGGLLQIGIMFFCLCVVMLVLNLASDGGVWGEFGKTFREIEQEGSVFGDSVGTNRMRIWKEMFQLLPMYWLFGCGIEHLGYVYLFTFGLTENFEYVDAAHNEYLHIWITRGIIPLLLYLVFLFALFIPGVVQYFKKKRYDTDDIKYMMLFPFFGYIAQAFFNISVIAAAPYFWLICGLLVMSQRKDVLEEIK